MKTGSYQWVSTRPTSELPTWFHESTKEELLITSGTTSVPKPGCNTTKMCQRHFSCLKWALPWNGIGWRAHGKEYSVFLPQGRSLGNKRPLARQKMERSSHTPNIQKWKSRNITPITANQHHLIQLKWQEIWECLWKRLSNRIHLKKEKKSEFCQNLLYTLYKGVSVSNKEGNNNNKLEEWLS